MQQDACFLLLPAHHMHTTPTSDNQPISTSPDTFYSTSDPPSSRTRVLEMRLVEDGASYQIRETSGAKFYLMPHLAIPRLPSFDVCQDVYSRPRFLNNHRNSLLFVVSCFTSSTSPLLLQVSPVFAARDSAARLISIIIVIILGSGYVSRTTKAPHILKTVDIARISEPQSPMS